VVPRTFRSWVSRATQIPLSEGSPFLERDASRSNSPHSDHAAAALSNRQAIRTARGVKVAFARETKGNRRAGPFQGRGSGVRDPMADDAHHGHFLSGPTLACVRGLEGDGRGQSFCLPKQSGAPERLSRLQTLAPGRSAWDRNEKEEDTVIFCKTRDIVWVEWGKCFLCLVFLSIPQRANPHVRPSIQFGSGTDRVNDWG
jgi:hypothetical protein